MEGDDEQTRFYTGLPSFEIFITLVKLIYSHKCSLQVLQNVHHLIKISYCLVLMKLRLAIPNLAYHFRIHVTAVSKVFHLWIDTLAES